jgi:aspartate-semialdehyde dehydrogenase
MVVALKPLHDAAKIKRVVVATYQSVSGSGKDAMDELFNQTKGVYMNDTPKPNVYTRQIAFNVIPHIDSFMEDGMTKEEWKMMAETKKILDPSIKVCASCVRVPVFIGHSEMVNVELENELTAADAIKLSRKAPGVSVVGLDNELEYATPVETQGEDAVFISRVREDGSVENGLNFWCVSDNLRKGAALNAIQIAELLIKKQLKAVA